MLISNCLTPEECRNIEKRCLQYVKKNPNLNEDLLGETPFFKNCYGICYPFKKLEYYNTEIIQRLNQLVIQNYGMNYEYTHAYLRIYYNESYLIFHTDKDDLDLTLSVNIGGLENWPMHISRVYNDYGDINPEIQNYDELYKKFKQDSYSVMTPFGSGVFNKGREYAHWRDTLHCEENEYVMQIFFHWKEI